MATRNENTSDRKLPTKEEFHKAYQTIEQGISRAASDQVYDLLTGPSGPFMEAMMTWAKERFPEMATQHE